MLRTSELQRETRSANCPICDKTIDGTTTERNEVGTPLHEECFALKSDLKKVTSSPSSESKSDGVENPLVHAITEFLNSAANASIPTACPTCGSDWQYRDSNIAYRGKTWGIRLPICVNCDPK